MIYRRLGKMGYRVTSVIPGAGTAEQARQTTAAASLPPFDGAMSRVARIYSQRIAPLVHHRR